MCFVLSNQSNCILAFRARDTGDSMAYSMASTSRKAFKLLKRSFSSSKDSEKEHIKVFSYNAAELEVHQLVTCREEALSDVLCALIRNNITINCSSIYC